MTHRDLYISWLNDAHEMEMALARVMENHSDAASDHPMLQARLQEHLQETRRHADLMKGCVERLGGETSGVKSGMATVMGTVQGMSTKLAKDEPVKNVLNDYGTEQFEAACYTSLQAAAEDLGDTETARICQDIIREELSMAEFLSQQIPSITVEMLRKEHAAAAR